MFCIRRETYKNKLINVDTFLDDLALGLYVNINKNKKYITSDILGEEYPNTTFKGLLKQRARWAIGYADILKKVYGKKEYQNKVFIHGMAYHITWLINWAIIIVLYFKFNWMSALFYSIFLGFMVSRDDLSLILYSIIYQFIFPIFHIKWLQVLFSELIKGRKKDGNKI